MSRTIIFGPPGTGKTTQLLDRAQQAFQRRERVAFVSFSRRALSEARTRLGASAEQTEHWRTIHATAYHLLGLGRTDVLQTEHLQDFGRRIGFDVHAVRDELNWDGSPADVALSLYHLAKARQTTVEQEWRRSLVDVAWPVVAHVTALYDRWKQATGLLDFTDMIALADGAVDVDTLFVDEAQDTSAAQWALLKRVFGAVKHVVIAGDDDQAVYAWSGADPERLFRLRGDREVLHQSYRVPRQVKQLADTLTARMHSRVAKQYTARPAAGVVQWKDLEEIDLRDQKSWLLLARSNYQLTELRRLAREQGVIYSMADGQWSWKLPCVRAARAYEQLRKGKHVHRAECQFLLGMMDPKPVLPAGRDDVVWEQVLPGRSREHTWMIALNAMNDSDREYVRMLRQQRESLTEPGRVHINTVHRAKGAQADTVVLLTDVSERVAQAAAVDPDAELRVQYVGVTRAFERLILVRPRTAVSWDF